MKTVRLLIISGGIILLDQGSKYVIQTTFSLYESVVMIHNFFSLTYVRNPGAAFGLLADQDPIVRGLFFGGASVIALGFLTLMFKETSEEDRLGQVSIGLLFAGAIGNLIDRVRMGEVVDFLDFYVGQYHWPVFNVADSAITIGISLMFFKYWLDRKAGLRANSQANSPASPGRKAS